MNRELKFRVWNIENKEWDNPAILEVWDESGKLEPFEYIKRGTLNSCYIPKENFIIQQFTGLKDKNGKEIYEGDIIRVFIGATECPYINLTIYWDINYFMFSTNAKMAGLYQHLCELDSENIEVIGNIFENPELLK